MTSRERRAILTATTRKIMVLVPLLQYAVAASRRTVGAPSAAWIVSRPDVESSFSCLCPKFKRNGACHHVDAVVRIVNGDATSNTAKLSEKRPVYPWDNRRRKASRQSQEVLILPLLLCLLRMLFPVPETLKQGRQWTDIADIIFSVVFRTQNHKSGDLAQSYIRDFWKRDILRSNNAKGETPPSVSALTNNMTQRRTLKAMHRVIRALAAETKDVREYAAMDASEYNLPTRDNSVPVPASMTSPNQIRLLQIMLAKLNIIVGVKTGMILAARVCIGKKHESRKAIALMEEGIRVKSLRGIIADKGYLSTSILQWLREHAISSIIPPKSNTKKIVGSLLGEHALWWFANEKVRETYGLRQRAECSNSSDKALNYENLRSKKPISQATELLGHVVLQNLRTLIWCYLNGTIDDITFMDGEVRQELEAVRRRLEGLPRPDLSPRYRDGLDAA